MPHELEYIVDKAVMLCDQGAKPNFFRGTNNTNVKINGCKVCITSDIAPLTNIPEFGVCSKTGSPCVPAPTSWSETYKVKVKGQQTLLYKSKLPCGAGGKIEFTTSGQVPVSQEELDSLMEEHGEEEEEEGLSWWDGAEMIPFAGGVIGMVRSGFKDPPDWLGFGLSAASLALDVAGLFSFGGGNAASAAVKSGKLARAGAKVVKAGKAAAKGSKVLRLTAKGAKALAVQAAKHVDDIALKTGKVCVFACFTAGTLVDTENGKRAIETIRVGDSVWAKDEETGEVHLKLVTATMQREVDATVLIELEGETIETTAEHPFYTQEGWKDAADLTAQDQLQTKENNWRSIKTIQFLYERKKVYNFEVSDWHTYFVGKLATWVHNAGVCLKLAERVAKYGRRVAYLGRTPGKASKTGREVFERMLKEVPPTARIRNVKGNKIKEFWDPDNKVWRNISEADMGHIHDAVTWWNKTGRKFGARSKKVRDWMLDPDNYVLEYFKTNRSKGSILGKTTEYKPPLK